MWSVMCHSTTGWSRRLSEFALPKSTRWFELTWRHKLWRLQQLGWIARDMVGTARQTEHDHRTHLRATLEWLCRAQDACRGKPHAGCIAGGWAFELGWLPGNIDDTGWLIETCLPAADYLDWPMLSTRARTMLDMLLSQTDSPSLGRIHGLIAGHVQIGDTACLPRAVQSSHALQDVPIESILQRAQTAQTLAKLGTLAHDANLIEIAQQHLDGVLAKQRPCGWFADTHLPTSSLMLAGMICCLIDTAGLLGDTRAYNAARLAAAGLRQQISDTGLLAAAFDDGWTPAGDQACPSAMAQLAIGWLRFAQLEPQSSWREAAWIALAWVKRNQRLSIQNLTLQGALPGAVPIWYGPGAFHFSASSAKYFADALMMDMVGITIPPTVTTRAQA